MLGKHNTLYSHGHVQLIHQTARDFILFDPVASLLSPENIRSQETISRVCIDYLTMTFPLTRNSSSNPKPLGREATISWKFILLLQDRPLLLYILEQLPCHLRNQDWKNCRTDVCDRMKEYLCAAREQPNSFAWTILGSWAKKNGLLDEQDSVTELISATESDPEKEFQVPEMLITACTIGALDAVRILFAVGQNLENVQKGAPILKAASRGRHLVVKELIRRGARTNVSDGLKDTPLHLAILGNHTLVVEELLKTPNLDVNSRNIKGETPRESAKRLHRDHIQTLLENY